MTLFEKMFGEKMTPDNVAKIMPIQAHPISLNPEPASREFIERQIARIERIKDIDTDEARAEIARCEENLKLSARTALGRMRIAIARRTK